MLAVESSMIRVSKNILWTKKVKIFRTTEGKRRNSTVQRLQFIWFRFRHDDERVEFIVAASPNLRSYKAVGRCHSLDSLEFSDNSFGNRLSVNQIPTPAYLTRNNLSAHITLLHEKLQRSRCVPESKCLQGTSSRSITRSLVQWIFHCRKN